MALGTGCMQTNFKNVATFEYSTCLKLLNKVSAQTFDMEQANIVSRYCSSKSPPTHVPGVVPVVLLSWANSCWMWEEWCSFPTSLEGGMVSGDWLHLLLDCTEYCRATRLSPVFTITHPARCGSDHIRNPLPTHNAGTEWLHAGKSK